MQPQTSALKPRDGVLILSGYGIRISVHHGRLSVSDNVSGFRRDAEFSRATSGIRRLFVLGHTGFVTFDALRWLADIEAAYVQVDGDGKVIASYAPQSVNDVGRRRAQALLSQVPDGVRIMRPILATKLKGQAALMRSRGHDEIARRIEALIPELAAEGKDAVRFVESRAADLYWRALAKVSMRFAKQDERKLPSHWRMLGPRHSLLGNAPRNAISPANALWNFVYSLIETEVRIALLAHGLDPEMGLLHSQRRFRNGLAHDLMEPMRPLADAWILDLLERRTFSQHDFVETRRGICRLAPPLPQAVAAMAPIWLERALPLASWLAKALGAYDESGVQSTRPSPLPSLTPVEERLSLMPRCHGCGTELREYRRKHCANCAATLRDASLPVVIAAGQSALRLARAAGHDPSQSAKARRARGRAVAQRHVEARAWRRTRTQMSEDRKTFQLDVLPVLQKLDVAELSRLTGLSKAQCSMVRGGQRTLHPRHWAVVMASARR